MSRRIGIREARRAAMKMAAAMVNDADFVSLFGEDFLDAIGDQDDGDDIMAQAQFEVVRRIHNLTTPRGRNHDTQEQPNG